MSSVMMSYDGDYENIWFEFSFDWIIIVVAAAAADDDNDDDEEENNNDDADDDETLQWLVWTAAFNITASIYCFCCLH